MAPAAYVLYELCGELDSGLGDVIYIGISGLLAGQSVARCLQVRKQYLQNFPKKCLEDCSEFEMSLQKIMNREEDALLEEVAASEPDVLVV